MPDPEPLPEPSPYPLLLMAAVPLPTPPADRFCVGGAEFEFVLTNGPISGVVPGSSNPFVDDSNIRVSRASVVRGA